MFAGDIYAEQKRLKGLIGKSYKDLQTDIIYRVVEVTHNIYKDVCMRLIDSQGRSRELVEGSEEYYKRFEEVI